MKRVKINLNGVVIKVIDNNGKISSFVSNEGNRDKRVDIKELRVDLDSLI